MSRIAKPKAEVKSGKTRKTRMPGREKKPGGNLNEWEKEVVERLKGKKHTSEKPEYPAGFVKVNRRYLLKKCAGLSQSEVMTRIAIDMHINKRTAKWKVRHKTLLPLAKVSLATLKRAIIVLEKKNIFRVEKISGTCNRYVDVELEKKIGLC